MALTHKRLEALSKDRVPGKYTDEQGLFLKITPAGGMYWQWRLRTPRETIVSYGPFPEVSLAGARDKHRQARDLRRNGTDPNTAKRLARATLARHISKENTFEVVAREWFAKKSGGWAKSYADKIIGRLEKDIIPRLGKLPIADVTPDLLLHALQKVEERGVAETAARCLESCSAIFRYAMLPGQCRCESNPADGLREALNVPSRTRHMPAITDPARLGQLMRMIYGYQGKGNFIVRSALQLAPLVLLRPGELRHGLWSEVDLNAAMWTIPAERMKGRQVTKATAPPHLVPLSRQTVEILRELKEVTGHQQLLFPGERKNEKPISENTINAGLRALGIDTRTEMTGHGFRATARTLIAEQLGYEDREGVIEAQLAHKVKDLLGRAYNRTSFVEQRRQMLQAWADYLDAIRTAPAPAQASANVVQLRASA